MRDWHWFSKIVRSTVTGSSIVADVLQAILNGNQDTVPEILKRAPRKFEELDQFLEEALKMTRTSKGRREIQKIMESHQADASFAVDDVSLRRAYVSYRAGLPVSRLPKIDDIAAGKRKS